MEEKKYNKRFCFAMSSDAIKDKFPFLKNITEIRGAIAPWPEGSLSIYSNGHYYFFVLEVAADLNLPEVKSTLKKYHEESIEMAPILNWLGSENSVPLERIFKKEPLDNQLVGKTDECKRTVMTLEIKNDPKLLKEYRSIHRPEKMWPQVLKNMDTMAIKDMELYLLAYQAFLIMDVDTHFNIERDGARWADLPQEQEWQQYVAKFQKVNVESKATEKWKTMELIYKT